MQLKNPKSIRHALQLATCTLLSTTTQTSHAANTNPDAKWLIDSAVLNYAEKDRVKVFEPVVSATRLFSNEESVELILVFDTMSGASPNGATATNTAQTFTGPSGTSDYTTEANKTPTNEFSDQRVALNINWVKPITRLTKRVYGGHISVEGDYVSLGANGSINWDSDNRLTTYTLGGAFSLDLISPTGGKPDELTNVNDPATTTQNLAPREDGEGEDEGEGENEQNPETKVSADILLGLTRVINRRTLMRFNYSHSFISGYLTDPYKIVSVVMDDTGINKPTPGALDKNVYLYEKRPDKRDTNSLYWQTLLHLRQDVVRVSYRYFWDDWGIQSHTADFKYRLELWSDFYLQPHYRYYQQTAADFYRHSIKSSEEPSISYVSADYRLGELTSRTVGIKLGKKFKNGGNIGLTVEQLQQSGNSQPDDAIGVQKEQDLFPTVEALIVLLSFSTNF